MRPSYRCVVTVVALELSRSPRSGGQARHFVGERLREAGLGQLVETAELVVTELVTNVLVHTGEVPVVRVRVDTDLLRVEVEDGSPVLPVGGILDVTAACGRGLLLVKQLVHRWGVSRRPGGKAVWFELVPSESEPANDLDVDQLLDLWDDEVDPVLDETGPALREASLEPLVPVAVEGVSAALLHDAKTHLDDLVRDLTLVNEAALEEAPGDDQVAALADRLSALATELIGFRNEMRRQALAASEGGDDVFTLRLDLPVSLRQPLADYRRALDEADEHCASGRLLLAPAPHEQVAFRRWKLDSIVAQLEQAARLPA